MKLNVKFNLYTDSIKAEETLDKDYIIEKIEINDDVNGKVLGIREYTKSKLYCYEWENQKQ